MTERCVCGSKAATIERKHGLHVLRCTCGIERQYVPMTAAELEEWYRTEYLRRVYYHTPEQDRIVADLRLDAYDLPPGARILDVGSGNGAFVQRAVARGYDAWGQEPSKDGSGDRIYSGEALEEVAFPSASFDVITMHDVLEHVPDPHATLDECRRILRDGGELIVDWPRFHHESGRHHWKPVEHIWLLNDMQLAELLDDAGFEVRTIYHPVESKTVIRATRPPERVHTVLVPPGIGDGYWVATKLRGFAQAEMITPEIWVHDAGPRRSEDFWRAIPFVRWGGYRKAEGPETRDAYRGKAVVQRDVFGCDYFISFNGTLSHGMSLDDAMPGLTEWYPPMHRSKAERIAEVEYRMSYGKYVVMAWWDKGFYTPWLNRFSKSAIRETAHRLMRDGYTVVLTGADWDRKGIMAWLKGQLPDAIDLVGQTTLPELRALIRQASGVVGHAAGSTMLGPVLGTPTVMLWGDNFPASMRTHAMPRTPIYQPMQVNTTATMVTDALKRAQSANRLDASGKLF